MFRDLIRDLVSNAFVTLDDLAPTATYVAVSDPQYNPETGAVIETTASHPVPAVFSRFGINELDDEIIVVTDMKVLIPAKDLPANPNENDRITGTVNGQTKTFNVQRILGVPGESLHILHVREV